MRIHKVIDALMRCDRQQFIPVQDKTFFKFADLLLQAEPFQFENVPMEIIAKASVMNENEPGYGVPVPTDEEREWVAEGLVPFPAPVCWYEYTVLDMHGALVVDTRDELLRLHRLFFHADKRPNPIGVWMIWNPRRKTVICDDKEEVRRRYALKGAEALALHADPSAYMMGIEDNTILPWFELNRERMTGFYSDAGNQALYLTLMINSRTTEMRTVRPDEKLVRAQVKRGQTPLPTHRLVNLVPRRFIDKADSGAPGRSGSHPRIHWRRSHMRHFDRQTPGAKWAEGIEHKGTKGWWVVPIPRFLVGRRSENDCEEVTHEYRVS